MFKIADCKGKTTDAIANLHWQNLERKKIKFSMGTLPYELDSLVRRLENVIAECPSGQATYFTDLKRNDYELLKQTIIGKPGELTILATSFRRKVANRTYPPIRYRSDNTHRKLFGDYLKYVFNYDHFIDKGSFWNAYELASLLGVDVCIYCNRNYTYTVIRKRNYTVRPEFDHFLSTADYPFLALSFYNLIPSCHICNSNLKHDHPFTLAAYLHPYIYSLHDSVKFTVEFDNKRSYSAFDIKRFYGVMFFTGKVDNFRIKLVRRNRYVSNTQFRKAINNIRVFHLEELYNCHKDVVTEMILNAIIYNEDKIDELFKTYGGVLFSSREDVVRHITKNFPGETDLLKRPFSKLSKDIHVEFGLKY